MQKKHVVLFQTKHQDWIAYSTTGADAKRIINVNKKHAVFYIFECNLLKQHPHTMKLKAPFEKYYDCKKIIKYKEESFSESDDYIIISYEDDDDGSICLDVMCKI
uniref:Uncharacterized protein n=1 Tax=viral metagenome TaxID=1070528 RepID=A0A6C0F553_9ZZZZ